MNKLANLATFILTYATRYTLSLCVAVNYQAHYYCKLRYGDVS